MRDQPLPPPRFSVVIPTCRRNESLARCLDRLAAGAQTLPSHDYEVIVADDGPDSDNARQLLRDAYPAVRWVAGPRRGPAANRNCGAAGAGGSWLVFTDDDCLPHADWLAAYANRIDRPGGSAPRVLEGPTTAGVGIVVGPFQTAPLNDKGGFLWSCNFAMERGLFEEMGGFDERFPFPHMEDVDLRMRLEDRKQAFPFVPEAVVEHPPRPLRPIRDWVESQESAFYLAHKRGAPASEFGQSVMTFLRIIVHTARSCRSAKEVVLATLRLGTGIFLIICRWPSWKAKYRR